MSNFESQEMSKSHLRKMYKSILKNLSYQYQINAIHKINAKICKRIRNAMLTNCIGTNSCSYNDKFNTFLEKPKYLMSFMKIPEQNEIDLNFINTMLSHKKRLVLPRVNSETNQLEVYQVDDLTTLIAQPPYNILEPDPTIHKLIQPEEIHIILVPGLAFDRQKNRLGRGKGYYDRFLKKVPESTLKIGVGFIEQYCPTLLPTTDHDVKVDEVMLPEP